MVAVVIVFIEHGTGVVSGVRGKKPVIRAECIAALLPYMHAYIFMHGTLLDWGHINVLCDYGVLGVQVGWLWPKASFEIT